MNSTYVRISLAAILAMILATAGYVSGAPGIMQGHLYEIIITAASFEVKSPKYIGSQAHMGVSRKNRASTPTINAFIPLLQDLPVAMNATWTAYQKYSNKWKESLIKGFINFCDLLQAKVKEYRIFYNYSNFPYKCPVVKGNYSINDFFFDTKQWPPVVPGNEWKFRIGWQYEDLVVLKWTFECKIDRTRELRAKKEHTSGKH